MSDEEEEDLNLKAGTEIISQKATYVVVRLLGEGGFRAVYLVKDNGSGKQHAMKLGTGKHFTELVDRGKKEKEGFFFLVMQLVGKSLADLKAERPEKVFSYQTGLGVSSQCLEAVEDLHKHGFIHRDLKPQNNACGLPDKRHLIYLLDFGIARRFMDSQQKLKPARDYIGFKGTVRFAPLACHRNLEMAPKDDCESWFYTMLDLVVIGGLMWKTIKDRNEVMLVKQSARNDRQAFYGNLKHTQELTSILGYIDGLSYKSAVDYQYIRDILNKVLRKLGFEGKSAFDWEREPEEREWMARSGGAYVDVEEEGDEGEQNETDDLEPVEDIGEL